MKRELAKTIQTKITFTLYRTLNCLISTPPVKELLSSKKPFYIDFLIRAEGHKRVPEMEFKEFEPRFKSAKTRFKFTAGLNLETFNTILSGTNHI